MENNFLFSYKSIRSRGILPTTHDVQALVSAPLFPGAGPGEDVTQLRTLVQQPEDFQWWCDNLINNPHPSESTTRTGKRSNNERKQDQGVGKFIDDLFKDKKKAIKEPKNKKDTALPASLATQMSDKSGPGSEVPVDEEKWEVEAIIDYTLDSSGGHMYLVKWKDWESEFNTWEPTENLEECESLLLEFYLKRKAQATSAIPVIPVEDYAITAKGHKRRKGLVSKLQVPPDPRPLEVRENEFYRKTLFPDANELRYWQLLWENLVILEQGKKKQAKDRIRWSSSVLDTNLALGIDQRLSEDCNNKLRGQLQFRRLDEQRRKNKAALREWENSMNAITEGKPTLTVENNTDNEGPPEGFTYVNDYIAVTGVNIPDDPPMGCSCSGPCHENKLDCCPGQFEYQFPYTRHRKLRVELGTPIYECNNKCTCGPECANRVVQDGRCGLTDIKLCIFRTPNGCGWGVKSLKSIKKGSFVTLYVGEVIESEEAERRGREYDANGCTYLFDLDFNEGDCPYTVDAGKVGNVAHFINHSCDPNLGVFAVWVNCLDPNLPKIALFAMRDIAKGEELTFDYMKQFADSRATVKNATGGSADSTTENSNFSSEESVSSSRCSSDEHAGSSKNRLPVNADDNLRQTNVSIVVEKKSCLCGSEKCRKVLF